jgi:hypothetical protein
MNTDSNMSYDVTAEAWEVTVALVVGGLKFRTSNATTIIGGDTRLYASNFLQLNGDNIPVTANSSYQIAPDPGISGHYRYTLTKV